jgi:tRNA threonylcarbamoyladenosine biosynthesis protein TsaB
MITLGIETATTVCGVAMVRNGMDPIEKVLDIPNVHSERLVPLTDELIRESGISLNQLDCIAVSIGPGSFTGLRIGLSVAKGLAHAADIPLIPVPTLEALAYNVIRAGGIHADTDILSMLDAHRGDAYRAVYRITPGLTLEEMAPAAITPYEVIAGWAQSQKSIIVVGDAAKIVSIRPDLRKYWNFGLSRCSPVSVGILGFHRYQSGEKADRSSLEPQYLREFVPRSSFGV